MKAGFAGQQEPMLMFPSLVGRPMLQYEQGVIAGHSLDDIMLGQDANAARSMLQISHPMKGGIVQNWEDMEALWNFTFSQMNIDPSEHKLVLTEPVMNPVKNRHKTFEVMFERFNFNAACCEVQPILALLSQGLKTGLVVDSGDGVTNIVPVYEGYVQEHCVRRMNIAGDDITTQLMRLLISRGYPLNPTADFESVRELKERLCYVALNLKDEQRYARETTLVDTQYTFPDSRVVRVGGERFMAPEMLFTPGVAGKESAGISELVYESIMKCPMDIRKELLGHIMLSGGNTMFPGMITRLERDVRSLQPEQARGRVKVHIEDPPQRQYCVFRGAEILAISKDQDKSKGWITKAQYLEEGPRAFEQRF